MTCQGLLTSNPLTPHLTSATDLIHGEHVLGGRGEGGESSLEGGQVHEVTEPAPVLLLVQQDGQGQASAVVQTREAVTLLLDAHCLHLGTQHVCRGEVKGEHKTTPTS